MKTKRAAAAVETVRDAATGVDLAKVDLKVVDKYMVLLCIEMAGTPNERVEVLSRFLREKVPADKLSACDLCRGESDVRFDRCPFCGDGSVDPRDRTPGEGEAAAISELVVTGGRKDAATAPTARARKRARPPAPVAVPAPANANGAEEAAAEAPPASGPAPKEAAPVEVEEHEGEVHAEVVDEAPAGALEVEPMTNAIVTAATELDLDQSIARIKNLNREAGVAVFDLGCEIFRNYSRKLYLQRRDGGGAPVYKSWTQFVEKELDVSVAYTYLLMDVSQKFTREDVALHGPSKLALVLRMPEDKQEEVRPRLGEISVRNLRQQAVEISGGKPRDTGRTGFRGTIPSSSKGKASAEPAQGKGKASAAPAPAPAPKGKAPKPQITIALAPGKVTIPLFARGPKAEGSKEKLKRAKKIGDDPHGTWELPNGTVIRIVLRANRVGELEALLAVEGG